MATAGQEDRSLYIRDQEETRQRGAAILSEALPQHASGFDWVREDRGIHSFHHRHTDRFLHMDEQHRFYGPRAEVITREAALQHAGLAERQQDVAQRHGKGHEGYGFGY